MKPPRPTPSPAPDPRRAAFAADVKAGEQLLAKCDAVIAASERDGQTLTALRNECAALNLSVDANDAAAVAVLAGKERQIALLGERVASVEAQLDRLAVDLKAGLLRAADSQRQYLQPVHAALLDETTAAFQPHLGNAARARLFAAESVRVRALTHTLVAHWQSDAQFDPVSCARNGLPQLRAIADGKQPWLD